MFRGLVLINRFYHGSTSRLHLSVTHGNKISLRTRRRIHSSTSINQMKPARNIQKGADYKIKKNGTFDLAKCSTISQANVSLDDLELCINGKHLSFNLTWLRDSCLCNRCAHEYSRQRLTNPKYYRREMFVINELQLVPKTQGWDLRSRSDLVHSDKEYIRMSWADGHESEYSLSWLEYIEGLYSKSQLDLEPHSKPKFQYPEDDFYLPTKTNTVNSEFWNVSELETRLQPVDYRDLIDGFKFNDDATFINANKIADMSSRRLEALKSLSSQLVTLGLAKIVNTPQNRNQVLNIARSLAYERRTGYGILFDVVVEPSEEINLAYSSLEFDVHSDLTYRETSPGVQLLHCICNSSEGGLSYFSDSFKAALLLQEYEPVLFEVLTQYPATFIIRDPYRDQKFRRQKPVISLDFQGKLDEVYYSPFMLPPVGPKEDVKLIYLALDKFTQLLQSPENKYVTKMQPGDVFIFHNRRVLHGRSAYDASTSRRFLQGCYMDWDEIISLHEKLIS